MNGNTLKQSQLTKKLKFNQLKLNKGSFIFHQSRRTHNLMVTASPPSVCRLSPFNILGVFQQNIHLCSFTVED